MREQFHHTASFQDTPRGSALDAFIDELIAQQLETPPSEAFETCTDEKENNVRAPEAGVLETLPPNNFFPEAGQEAVLEDAIEIPAMANVIDADAGQGSKLSKPADEPAEAGPAPIRVYSFSDLLLFEQLTGYRLVAQRQLWRAVDKEGNRSMAGDRLFTVLAEEAFQMADRKRRNGPNPLSDLAIKDIAIALEPMRSIAAHLGERGIKAADRLEAIVVATLNRRAAA